MARRTEAFRLDGDDLSFRRERVEGERNAADQAAAADWTEQEIRFRAFRGKLVERLESGTALSGDDFWIVERMQQRQAFIP